ncbi:MAG: RHS repeat-associated core domain-containing protein, partial [Gammaproteobacteria bacterium]|nr:RHS repeat-associated core domain-containing protein [Gammaproteobacteria bacterium]
MGVRVQQVNNGVTADYLVDLNREHAQVLEERDQAGALVVRYERGDDLISQTRSGAISYYHYDGLGSTRALTDAAEAVTDIYTYDAFGNLIAQLGSTPNEFLFAGEQLDANSGFYYLRARYYHPDTGRFLTPDVFSGFPFDPPSLHRYTYTENDPVNNVDPSGKFISGAYVAALGRGVLSALANVRLAFLISRSLGGAALRTLGIVVENAVGRILVRIPGAVVSRQIALVGAGGRRVLDFLVRVGNRVAVIEVKFGLPRTAGPALTRLVGQIQTALTAADPAVRGAQVVLFTFRAPTAAQMARLLQLLGPQAGSLQHVQGLWGLVQWARFFFLPIP